MLYDIRMVHYSILANIHKKVLTINRNCGRNIMLWNKVSLDKKKDPEDLEKPEKVEGHWYPLCIIFLCIRLVIVAASPLRTAANSLNIIFETLPETSNYTAPSRTAITRWMQKLGYYKLKRSKVIADDWMVVIDASIQMGEQKCLAVFGIRQSSLPKKRALKLEDLEVLDLRISSTINSNLITQALNDVASSIGTIICVCSDRGSDILRGVKDFQIISPKTLHFHDTAHRIANFLKAILENNHRWKKFREQVTQTRRKMQNSLVAGALPPSPRTKARFMNVDSLIKWAAEILVLIDNENSAPEVNMDELKKYLSWLSEYREDIYYWNRLISIGASARQLLRKEGIHKDISDHFEDSICTVPMGPREQEFANQILMFLLEQSKGLTNGERYIGSTEVIESFFGKLKYMEHEQTAFGFTSLVLAAMGCVGRTDAKIVKEAMTYATL